MTFLVGLTGGIGSGKSTVARRFAVVHGFDVIDADQLARDVVEVGEPALDAIAARFGTEVLRPDGSLDRAALAAVVFADEQARRDLEAITHPRIRERIDDRLQELAEPTGEGGQRIVVLDHPLLVETRTAARMDAVVVVEAPADVRVERLVSRGLDEADARARIAAQAGDEQRRTVATHVIDNGGDLPALERQVDEVAGELRRRAEEER